MNTPAGVPTEPIRILFLFGWLVVGGEETEVRLLAANLDRARYRLEVVVCFHKHGMPEQTHHQLAELGVSVDTTPYHLNFHDTVVYLASRMAGTDIVVACQNVADLYPALERMHLRPKVIEHGGLVSEAQSGPKHFTSRYVGVCASIREAAAARLPDRPHHALEIPSMVDLSAFDPTARIPTRHQLGIADTTLLIGWVGRLDPKKRVEDFIEAAALVHATNPTIRFVVIGGPDAFMPEYADSLRHRVHALGMENVLTFLGDRADIPALLAALDIFVWLSRGEGMPHVIAEAGAASLPVIATADNGTIEQIQEGISGLFVPHENPAAVAQQILALAADPDRRRSLGAGLRAKIVRDYAVQAVLPAWETLFTDVLAERPPPPKPTLFRSFFHGGFESSTHRRAHDRRRLDMIDATAHDRRAESDYTLLQNQGLLTVRDGLRWHLIEITPGVYDWSSLDLQLEAARATGTQVIWDLLHYGWPDDIDIWRPEFITRFAAFAAAASTVIAARTPGPCFYAPVNEISFFSWGGGDAAYLNPFANGRGFELKIQLTRAAIAAMDAILAHQPSARFVHADPVINVIHDINRPHEAPHAQGHRQAQFHAWDMIAGNTWPQFGGRPELLDIIGLNYYFNNQWIHGGPTLDVDHPAYRPFRFLLADVYARYGRPIFVAETGIEGERRAPWLRMICAEVNAAIAFGVPVEGICLYPVLGHPGWDDERDCPNGLVSATREIYEPLSAEIKRQVVLL